MSQFDKHIAHIDAALLKHLASPPIKTMGPWEPGAFLFGGLFSGITIFAALLVVGANFIR
jgi:hypothetical protein